MNALSQNEERRGLTPALRPQRLGRRRHGTVRSWRRVPRFSGAHPEMRWDILDERTLHNCVVQLRLVAAHLATRHVATRIRALCVVIPQRWRPLFGTSTSAAGRDPFDQKQ